MTQLDETFGEQTEERVVFAQSDDRFFKEKEAYLKEQAKRRSDKSQTFSAEDQY